MANGIKILRQTMQNLGVDCMQNKTFAELNTLRCGGRIKLVICPDSVNKLVAVLRALDDLSEPYTVVGNGSNLLASDGYYDGVAVCTKLCRTVEVLENTVTADCGANTAKVFALLRRMGLGGGEFLGCIPSTVGAAVRGNAGCFGQDTASVVTSVVAYDGGKIRRFDLPECGFAKRSSVFKQCGMVVLRATMRFAASTPEAVSRTFADMYALKSATQPLGEQSAGSMLYHDVEPLSLYLDVAGLRGFRHGGAAVSKKHAGFVINIDKAASKDIYYILRYEQRLLREEFGLDAQVEVSLVNFDGEPPTVPSYYEEVNNDIFPNGQDGSTEKHT